jgi:hypothetical protein
MGHRPRHPPSIARLRLILQVYYCPPNYFTRVEIKHVLRGDVDPEAVERALYLSETKYCAVGAMTSKAARIENKFEIIEEKAAEVSSALVEATQ